MVVVIVLVMSLAMTVDVVKVVVVEAVGLVKRAGGEMKVAAVTKMVVMSAAAKLEAMRLLAAAVDLQVRACFLLKLMQALLEFTWFTGVLLGVRA